MADKYTMRISLNALKHLGIGLYSNIPAVLSEVVANAWDADASNVTIIRDFDGKTVTIQDDGHGMSVDDANKKYLCVGYERRKEEGGITQKERPVMGRKGIGKLSLFSIANTVTVHSVKNGERHGFRMNVDKIEHTLENANLDYHPTSVSPADDLAGGTRITLSDLKLQLRKNDALKTKIARRFSVISDEFKITVDGKEITPQDRGYQDKLQYAWALGSRGELAIQGASNARHFSLSPAVHLDGSTEQIDGWIGTARESGQLKDAETKQSINRIVIMVRGKIAQEDILEELGESSLYSKYVVGEIHADFLDRDEEDDIATTSRQKIKEDDPRYIALRKTIQEQLKAIESKWTCLRNEEGSKEALAIPQIKEWYDKLPSERKNLARKLFGRINEGHVDDKYEKRRLFISGILAFESLKLRDMLDNLDHVSIESLDMLKDTFLQLRDLEATTFYQTTNTRLEVIRRLEELTDTNALERVVQEFIFDNLWLIDSMWQKSPGTEVMEKTIRSAFEAVDKTLTDEEIRARVDIKYREVGNKHVVIELKRPDTAIKTMNLVEQLKKYRKEIRKRLQNDDEVEFVCVLGRKPDDWTEENGEATLRAGLYPYSFKILMYDHIIENAQKTHKKYIEDRKDVSRIFDLVMSIDSRDKSMLTQSGS